MTLPTGTIGMDQVNSALGASSSAIISLNDTPVRWLAQKTSGAISMDDLRGKTANTYAKWTGGHNYYNTVTDTTVTNTNAYWGSNAVANIFKSSGYWYWEVKITACGANASDSVALGIALSYMTPINVLGNDSDSAGWYNWDMWRNNGTVAPAGGTYSIHNLNDVIGFALNMPYPQYGNLRIYVNGSFAVSYILDCSGGIAPAVSSSNNPVTYTIIANFGASAFAYSPPAGYNPGWYT